MEDLDDDTQAVLDEAEGYAKQLCNTSINPFGQIGGETIFRRIQKQLIGFETKGGPDTWTKPDAKSAMKLKLILFPILVANI